MYSRLLFSHLILCPFINSHVLLSSPDAISSVFLFPRNTTVLSCAFINSHVLSYLSCAVIDSLAFVNFSLLSYALTLINPIALASSLAISHESSNSFILDWLTEFRTLLSNLNLCKFFESGCPVNLLKFREFSGFYYRCATFPTEAARRFRWKIREKSRAHATKESWWLCSDLMGVVLFKMAKTWR